MIHKYSMNGFNIVLDVNSGAVHVVDDAVYDVLDFYKEKTKAILEVVKKNPILANKTEIFGATAGRYCNMIFDINLDEKKVRQLCLKNGIKISALTTCIADTKKATLPINTYNMGYGELKISEIRDGLTLFANIFKQYFN